MAVRAAVAADEVKPLRLARFIIATHEGALLMSRVKQERAVLVGIAADLKRYIGSQVPRGALQDTDVESSRMAGTYEGKGRGTND